jgi:DUF4097 and DUF4098 domain-containing protein YvlB
MRIVSLLPAMMAAAFGSAAARAGDFERQVPADPHGVVEISNVAGTIEVSGWDRPEVSVRAELAGGVDHIDITGDHGRTTIKVQFGHHFSWRDSGGADLRVQIPRGSELNITAVSADITTSDIDGAQRLQSVSGQIKADLAQSDVEVKTVSGDISLHGRRHSGRAPVATQPFVSSRLRVSTISGALRLEHGSRDFEATTVSGDLNVRLDLAREVRVRTTSGDLHFEGKLTRDANFEAQSVSGGLHIRAPAEAGYEYEVNSFSGDISDCFGAEPERTSKYAPGHRLDGTRAEGSAHVWLKTMSGEVDLCDKP